MSKPLDHTYWMHRCLVLARKDMGKAQPNPMVGSILVNGKGKCVSQGYHHHYGSAHAEVDALKNISDADIKNCTLYVNLEPCAHQGQTGPCCEYIVKRGVKKVVYGCMDPNPKVAGKGLAYLKTHGVKLVGPVLETECLALNQAFIHSVQEKKPWVTAKFAVSKNGYMGSKSGQVTISGDVCQRYTMKLRALSAAVMLGVDTINIDDPRLTVRGKYSNHDLKVLVVDPSLRMNRSSQILNDPERIRMIYDSARASQSSQAFFADKGVHLCSLKTDAMGKFIFSSLWTQLHAEGMNRILVEGGKTLLESLDQQNAINDLFIYQSQHVQLLGDDLVKQPAMQMTSKGALKVIKAGQDSIFYHQN